MHYLCSAGKTRYVHSIQDLRKRIILVVKVIEPWSDSPYLPQSEQENLSDNMRTPFIIMMLVCQFTFFHDYSFDVWIAGLPRGYDRTRIGQITVCSDWFDPCFISTQLIHVDRCASVTTTPCVQILSNLTLPLDAHLDRLLATLSHSSTHQTPHLVSIYSHLPNP